MKCCVIECQRDAEFQIYGESNMPDDVTEACEKHVGTLLGTPVGVKPENRNWTVVEL